MLFVWVLNWLIFHTISRFRHRCKSCRPKPMKMRSTRPLFSRNTISITVLTKLWGNLSILLLIVPHFGTMCNLFSKARPSRKLRLLAQARVSVDLQRSLLSFSVNISTENSIIYHLTAVPSKSRKCVAKMKLFNETVDGSLRIFKAWASLQQMVSREGPCRTTRYIADVPLANFTSRSATPTMLRRIPLVVVLSS